MLPLHCLTLQCSFELVFLAPQAHSSRVQNDEFHQILTFQYLHLTGQITQRMQCPAFPKKKKKHIPKNQDDTLTISKRRNYDITNIIRLTTIQKACLKINTVKLILALQKQLNIARETSKSLQVPSNQPRFFQMKNID